MKESEKLHQLPTPFQVNVQRCFEGGLTQWIKRTYRELRSVLGLLKKISWCANGANKQHLIQQYDFPFNVYKSVAKTNSKEQALLMDQGRGKYSIQSS